MGLFGNKYKGQADEELMWALRDRDSGAFSELYDRYSERLINYFHRMLWHDREKAEDFTQDIFAKLIDKPELYKEGRNFKTWLFSIANNMCKNEYRKNDTRKTSPQEILPNYAVTQSNTEQKMDAKAFGDALEVALGELDETKRNTFVLRYKFDMSIKEIGEVLDCSEGTVKSRLFYTLKTLNSQLKTYENVGIMAIVLWIIESL